MPANCSADVVAVISHVDSIFTGTNKTAINETKALFGMGGLSHLDDVTSAREFFDPSTCLADHLSQSGTQSGPGRICSPQIRMKAIFSDFVMRSK
jgi:hypothetical protein